MNISPFDYTQLAQDIKQWGQDLGFQQVGISDTDLSTAENHLAQWLAKGYHGSMAYMARHGDKRSQPEQLIPGTLRIISVRMDYSPSLPLHKTIRTQPDKAVIACYALGRDYHKVLKKRLQALTLKINEVVGPFAHRAFVDSAPVLEKPIAVKAGLGWQGKNTNLLNQSAGSYFFLGELYTDLPLPVDQAVTNRCGSCHACLDICPTQALIAPYQLDARRCISYLTIENRDSIPLEFRKAIGNRIYGCDDCQIVCPWNRYAKPSTETDFAARHGLDDADLLDLFAWSEDTFLSKTEGSAIRRIGHVSWLRNIAVALGNATTSPAIRQALLAKADHPSPIVREHVAWALSQHAGP